MTESEAKTKWCPLSRVVVVAAKTSTDIVSTTNRGICFSPINNDEVKTHTSCIASACMFWREYQSPVPYYDQNRDHSGAVITQRTEGYCGAAGK